jgi:hypothetical protein
MNMESDEEMMLLVITCGCVSAIIIFGFVMPSHANLSNNNSAILTNYTTMPTNSIRIGNCIFPLKLYNNMTAPQIENATLICYK